MSKEQHYRMLTNGMTGKIKRSEIVVELSREIGISVVRKPDTDIIDYVLPDDRVKIPDSEVPQ